MGAARARAAMSMALRGLKIVAVGGCAAGKTAMMMSFAENRSGHSSDPMLCTTRALLGYSCGGARVLLGCVRVVLGWC